MSKVEEFNIDKAQFDKLNEEAITSSLITPDRLYMDLALIKDLTIGVIISFLYDKKEHISNEEYSSLYKQMIDGLPKYIDRTFDDFEYLFPFLNKTNKEFEERLHDPKYAKFILHNAPITQFKDVLTGQLFINKNHSAVINKIDAIELTVNTYPLKLDKTDEYIVAKFLADNYKVNVNVLYIDLKNIDDKHVLKYDEIYTYFPRELFESSSIRKAYTEMKYIKKRLFLPRIFFGKYYKDNFDIVKEELLIQTRMDILTNLKYFPASNCSTVLPTIATKTS